MEWRTREGSLSENEIRHDAVPIEASSGDTMKYAYAHEAGDGWELAIKGGTKSDRDAAIAWAKQFAEGWLHKPRK